MGRLRGGANYWLPSRTSLDLNFEAFLFEFEFETELGHAGSDRNKKRTLSHVPSRTQRAFKKVSTRATTVSRLPLGRGQNSTAVKGSGTVARRLFPLPLPAFARLLDETVAVGRVVPLRVLLVVLLFALLAGVQLAAA